MVGEDSLIDEPHPLTNFQMAYLKGKEEPADPRRCKFDIRRSLRSTLLNGEALVQNVDEEQRDLIFRPIKEDIGDTEVTAGMYEEAYQLHRGIKGWLAFLYAGVESQGNLFLSTNYETEDGDTARIFEDETPSITYDFETMLRDAIAGVARTQGQRVTDFTFEVQTEPIQRETFDIERLHDRFEDADPTLSGQEIAALRRAGVVDTDDIAAYHDEALDSTVEERGGGFMSDEKAGEWLEELRNEAADETDEDE